MLLLSNGLNDHQNRLKEKFEDLAANVEKHERGLPDDVEDKWMDEWKKSGLFDKQPMQANDLKYMQHKLDPETLEQSLLQADDHSGIERHRSGRHLLSEDDEPTNKLAVDIDKHGDLHDALTAVKN